MFETQLENKLRPTIQVLLGFLLGTLLSLVCLFSTLILGGVLGVQRVWIFPALNAAALLASGIATLRRWPTSNYAQGVLIALSVALLLDAFGVACLSNGPILRD